MNIFDAPSPGTSSKELAERMRRIRDYVRDARDPNESGADGRTLLLLALSFCSTVDGEELIANLLDRGADPNKPSAWANFTTVLTVSNSLPLVKQLVEHGLQLNDIYDVNGEGQLTQGPCTLLDYVDAVRNYISPKKKRLDALARKYSGGLGKRRRFIEETIALLESHGARRSSDIV